MQSLRSTARLSDAANDNDNDGDNCDFIVVDLCVVQAYISFATKMCNIKLYKQAYLDFLGTS